MIRLNLGCGDKIYDSSDGWINVDIIPPKEVFQEVPSISKNHQKNSTGYPEFHQTDLKNLENIEDNTADEIHAYHVIEHFYRDDVPAVLAEWLRVLKPNGILVLEQPDVIKCAANLLAGVMGGQPTMFNQLGVLGFYGAGTPEEPYMSHKWGWTAITLAPLLEAAGFVNVKEKTAKTHAKNVRDFRLVGAKPNE